MSNRAAASRVTRTDAPHMRAGNPGKSSAADLSDREFDELRSIIKKLTGISLSDSKRQLVYRRVSGRLKALGIETFREYCDYLRSDSEGELEEFTNSITTNLTSFFREQHHFDYLVNTLLPEIMAGKASSGRRLRIWSAGCSTGEEAYSLAITLRESWPDLQKWDARILATDLDTEVLSTCRAGLYPAERVEKMPRKQRNRWFLKSSVDGRQMIKVRPELRELITFKQLNLMEEWPMRGKFDVIFCRNVMIYFDKPTQKTLVERYAGLLENDGHLFVGHSESLFNVTDRFTLLGKTIYRKKG